MAKNLTARSEDYSRWYNDLVQQAELADYAPVKGCMVIRPNGYALWENIQRGLDDMFKETGHSNAYFPLLIPESFMKKEAEHVKGFAPECAVVTHGGGKKLEEPLYIRPTSETIIYHMYSKWIQSYRDLPLLLNQWANVVRWEMRTRLFLRTTEFLWQEGHTAHATEAEAEEETLQMLDVYYRFARDFMAIDPIRGLKTDAERFAGAVRTYCIEAMMQDHRALQAGTSHNLGQNFAKAFDVKFQSKEGKMEYVWNTSWGVSTRLVGALIMAHSDDNGLVAPPRLAPVQAVVIPIARKDDERARVLEVVDQLEASLKGRVRLKVDRRREVSPGRKFNEWELKGACLRLELGPRDVAAGHVTAVSRLDRSKENIPLDQVAERIPKMLDDQQAALLENYRKMQRDHTHKIEDYGRFNEILDGDGGFLLSHWCGGAECETKVKTETKATIRCIPLDAPEESGTCICCEGPSSRRVIFARAY